MKNFYFFRRRFLQALGTASIAAPFIARKMH